MRRQGRGVMSPREVSDMGGLVRLVSAKMSQKGSCRKCFQSRETGDHTKCDRVRPEVNIHRQHGRHHGRGPAQVCGCLAGETPHFLSGANCRHDQAITGRAQARRPPAGGERDQWEGVKRFRAGTTLSNLPRCPPRAGRGSTECATPWAARAGSVGIPQFGHPRERKDD